MLSLSFISVDERGAVGAQILSVQADHRASEAKDGDKNI